MISIAPLPTWKQLLSLFWISDMKTQQLVKSWLKENDHAFFFSKSAWSLYAILLWWERIFNRTKPNLWVPDYFCNKSLAPVRMTSAKLIFYPIDKKMQPDWNICQKLAETTPPDLFILVHYFGEASNGALTKQFCQAYHSLLIEDSAHVLLPDSNIEGHGDFVLYSPHKLLAMPDGAICIMRKLDKFICTQEVAIETMRDIQWKIMDSKYFPWSWLIKRIMQKLLPDLLYKPKIQDFQNMADSYRSYASYATTSHSFLSKRLLKTNLSNLTDIANKRKECFECWEFLLSNNYNLLLSKFAHPYMVIYQASDFSVAQTVYSQLTNNKWPVSTWPDLPPEVIGNPLHRMAEFFRYSRIFLPINHTLSLKQLTHKFLKFPSADKKYRLQWNILQDEWEAVFNQIEKSNLLQSWNYGEAKKRIGGWSVKRAFIFCEDKIIGLIQCLEKRVSFMVTLMRINRGPLWLTKPSTDEIFAVFSILKKSINLKKRTILIIAPELFYSVPNKMILMKMGYKKSYSTPNQSTWIDLNQSEDMLRSLNGKWRNQLRLAEKSELQFQIVKTQKDYYWLIARYTELTKEKNFKGISISLLKMLNELDPNCSKISIMKALSKEGPIACALIISHGKSCTFTICWINEKGRQINAMNFLLWNSILAMKKEGIKWFDVSGINAITDSFITKFKRGFNSAEYELVGEYYYF